MDASAPPPRSVFAPFHDGSRAWLVLLRNALPVIGAYALHFMGGERTLAPGTQTEARP